MSTVTPATVLPQEAPVWLRTGQVARQLGVDPKTVARWAREGKIASHALPTGRLRYREADVVALLEGRRTTV